MENEIRDLSNNLGQTEQTHYNHKLYSDKETAFESEAQQRHDQEVELYTALKTKKQKELDDLKAALAKLEKDFLAMKDYQNALAETEELRQKIEDMKVKTQYLEIHINILSETVEALKLKADDLAEEKKLAEMKHQELETQLQAQEEIAKKRLQAKLNREKSAEVKELIAVQEIAQGETEEIGNKLLTQKETYDNFLSDKITLEEQFRRREEDFKIDTAAVEE